MKMAEESINEATFKTDINLYEKGRPEYTRESVEYLLKQVGALRDTDSRPLTILELGAGTGKFTRVMVEVLKKFPKTRIIASDSEAPMCEKFKKILPGIEIMQFSAEKIEMPDKSVDIVISAQSFHWFANPQTVSEIHRVLVPRGTFGMIWNSRNYAEVDWVAKIQEIIEPICRRDNTPNNLDNTWMKPIKDSKLFMELEGNTTLRLYQEGSADDMMNTYMCISSVSKSSNDEKREIESRIRGVLMNHPDLKGMTRFKLPYVTPIYWCTKL